MTACSSSLAQAERRKRDSIFGTLDDCTVFMALGTFGVVEPAASFVAHVGGRARTIYVGPSSHLPSASLLLHRGYTQNPPTGVLSEIANDN